VAGCGIVIIAIGALLQVIQLVVSVIQRKKNEDKTGDPWDGRTLEWATSSPPPVYNFAVIPQVTSTDAFWETKQGGRGKGEGKTEYEDIEMPKHTAMGIYTSGFILAFGFAMIWHIWWLVILSLFGAIGCVIIRSFDEETEYVIPAAKVAKMEGERKTFYD